MAPDPPPPLPLAPNRATISNRISLLLSNQSSVLKSMNLSRPDPTTRRPRPVRNDDDDDDLRGASRPNEGVGYVAEKPVASATSREERFLRGKAARGASTAQQRHGGKRKLGDDSESDEDEGRSALGKRKRRTRAGDEDVQVGPAAVEAEETTREEHKEHEDQADNREELDTEATDKSKGNDVSMKDVPLDEQKYDSEERERRKKDKKKRKRQRHKQNAVNAKQENEATTL